ncbi:site-2 protease family protein [Nocardia cyriacigeorgica]|uniref:Zinc metalloprotease Rip1 n=3 Tax=Nocardia cyriacigeorgica TaxID=135487 RepID=A0A4U8W8Y7_9NOCA|nr:site-2 protease family protein [Nocardia cyriacigeorgica]MBF6089622.1 site-2 protease family protein [Nocardia cyriacigeorgica]MBF6094418.1 site-2 protease family protein [Nocardia cyriacigeorgica]MBF6097188.1 site-2 protease family protein [Nocardia cyriacigeorgica]MBF6158663.1 site-2 protease family protein [Nocardia cyriacigeorgica]MBF6197650.1 site-2 protease family protein [Nocardia cyriacigeorgica]
MVFAFGFALFALGITISIALHECGHMWAAQATGMKVRRYFIGFGPRIFSFRRGETEYGLKALPLGGFCDIAGMTALDELEPEELDRAMYRQATWKRLVVMFGGIAMNFLLGFLLVVVLAVGWGLPNFNQPPATALGEMSCVATQNPDGTLAECTGTGPAQRAGLQRGDVVKAVNGVEVETWREFQTETQNQTGPFTYTIERDGQILTIPVTPERVIRYPSDGGPGREVSAVGVGSDYYEPVKYNVLAAIPAAGAFTGDMFVRTFQSLAQMPAKVADLWTAVTGGERDPETPVSVYGASKIGGETAERGLWGLFILVLASLNFFLGAFNLLPLLPLDGGHIAVVLYEKLRNTVRGWKGLAPGAPVDYLKLLPVTYVAVVIGGAYMVLTLVADIVNPIELFP